MTTPLAHPQAISAARLFGWIRIAIGVVLLAAPRLWSRGGFTVPERSDALTAVRSAAVRDLALGVGALRAEEPAVLAQWVDAGVVVDAGDVYTLLRARGMRPWLRAAVLLTATGATLVGTAVSRSLRD